jgi:DNA-directed RNA polymerase I, II, and III subunit RPABC4
VLSITFFQALELFERRERMQGQPQPQVAKVPYVCGSCGVDLNLKLNDTVQCTECGGRILYKKRTRQIVQFEAR